MYKLCIMYVKRSEVSTKKGIIKCVYCGNRRRCDSELKFFDAQPNTSISPLCTPAREYSTHIRTPMELETMERES